MFPPAVGSNFLGGEGGEGLLARLGRSTAFELWEARAQSHLVVDAADTLQVVAMGRSAQEKLCHEDAEAAVCMLNMSGKALQEALVQVGILTDMESASGVMVSRCTSLSRVRASSGRCALS